MPRFLRPPALVMLFFAISCVAQAQWLVYELRFKEEAGSVNFSFYTGAYVVAPVNGGAASIVFTTEDGGSFYAASENSLRYYIAANRGERQAVLSAFTINGTAQAFYSASGGLNSTVSYTEDGAGRTSSVAATLSGMLLASDDESFHTPSSNGSLGMVGRASISATLRDDLTQIVNTSTITMSDAVGSITALLEKYGYKPDVGDVPSGTMGTAPATPAEPVEQPNSDVSALFGGQQEPSPVRMPAEPETAGTSPSLFPPFKPEAP